MQRFRFVLLLALASCAHAPPPLADRVWPAPPLAARARYAGTFPDPTRDDSPPWWKRAWRVFIGKPSRARREAPLLARPFGVTTDGDRLVVTDADGGKVLRVDWRTGAREEVTCAGHDWVTPMAAAARPEALFVADGGAGVVARIDRHGGCTLWGEGGLVRPAGLALSGDRLYVVDPPAHDLVAFDAAGRPVARFGGRGAGEGELNFPTGVAAGPGGDLFVVDAMNFRIVRFRPDGTFVSSFGQGGDTVGDFGRPKAISAMGDLLFVSDDLYDVVLVLDARGGFELALGGSGAGPGDLTLPAGVAASGGRVYVADSYNHRIEAYDLLGAAP